MPLNAKLSLSIHSDLSGTPDRGSAVHSVVEKITASFANGTGANQANNMFVDDFTISGAGAQTYDLAGGLTNGIGVALTFTALKALIVRNSGTAELSMGGGSNPFLGWLGASGDLVKIPAGGLLLLTDPTAAGQGVTAGTGDILRLSGTDAAGSVWIIGEA